MSATWISSITELKNHVTIYDSDSFTTFILKGRHNLDISLNEIFQDEYECCMLNYNSTLKILSVVCTNKVDNPHGTFIHKGGIEISCPDSNHQSVWISNGHTYRIFFSQHYKCVLSIRTDTKFSNSDVQIHTINITHPLLNPDFQMNGDNHICSMIRTFVITCLLTIISFLLLYYALA